MHSNILIPLLVALIAIWASHTSAYTCVSGPYKNAACFNIDYDTGGFQANKKAGKPGAPNLNTKFGCADGNTNTPLCCVRDHTQADEIYTMYPPVQQFSNDH
ncbi:hypothetical protein PCANC_00912 [Puccinia coronata f. sp. avenae]|uniref:Hydrophobin n=1 Tax=Puccinia coronata f. sp. avenae TaxID=200324 RepID=A0A2N5W7N2_9BASI|nr:hypothetical protein PCANC_19510 [Puccinia coronata f. sp. avenae]PLW21011.1 hypothetical protein PCASD_15108 [Puccinia coronata f. sp. avenae]PLW48074.1 hypothetical protein PCASD_03629 [Puccinia coronata f. sp. avenae]PLW58260.1 hypothetical protein PCANC_00912 [Puccinia coronata f. sp. avenae]